MERRRRGSGELAGVAETRLQLAHRPRSGTLALVDERTDPGPVSGGEEPRDGAVTAELTGEQAGGKQGRRASFALE